MKKFCKLLFKRCDRTSLQSHALRVHGAKRAAHLNRELSCNEDLAERSSEAVSDVSEN